jgi:hypothetical protein
MSTKRKTQLLGVLDGPSADELAAARAEDVKVAGILRRARTRPVESDANPDVARRSAEFMTNMRLGSERALARRIQSRELVTKGDLVAMLSGRRRWVNAALRAGRLFSLTGPSGIEYFPAFVADDSYELKALGRVTKALQGIPGASKYFFFTTISNRLGMTPLEALAHGRTADVVVCAVGFAESCPRAAAAGASGV